MDELFGSSGSDSDDMEGLGAGPFEHLTDSTIRIGSFLMDDLFTVSVVFESNRTTNRLTDQPIIKGTKKKRSITELWIRAVIIQKKIAADQLTDSLDLGMKKVKKERERERERI